MISTEVLQIGFVHCSLCSVIATYCCKQDKGVVL